MDPRGSTIHGPPTTLRESFGILTLSTEVNVELHNSVIAMALRHGENMRRNTLYD